MLKVMRLTEGDCIEIVNGQGQLGKASLQKIQPALVSCVIHDLIFEKKKHSFIIAQSIVKPALLELVIEKNTELGAEELWIFPGTYSEKKELTSHQLERLHKHLVGALKQCGRLYLPLLRLFTSLEQLLAEPNYHFLYGDTSPSAPRLSIHHKPSEKVPVFVVGPEKGFHEKELAILKERKAEGVSLHSNILRAETASITASALLSAI